MGDLDQSRGGGRWGDGSGMGGWRELFGVAPREDLTAFCALLPLERVSLIPTIMHLLKFLLPLVLLLCGHLQAQRPLSQAVLLRPGVLEVAIDGVEPQALVVVLFGTHIATTELLPGLSCNLGNAVIAGWTVANAAGSARWTRPMDEVRLQGLLLFTQAVAVESAFWTSGQVRLSSPVGMRIAPLSQVEALEQAVGNEINRVRFERALPPLRWQADLAAFARAHSVDLVSHNLFSHTGSDGRDFGQRWSQANLPYIPVTEILCGATSQASTIVQLWLDSAPHAAGLLAPQARHLGVGAALGGQGSVIVNATIAR